MKYILKRITRLIARVFSPLSDRVKDFSKLEKMMQNLPAVSLQKEEKNALKEKILARIKVQAQETRQEESSYQGLIARIAKIAAEIHPNEYFRILLKERLVVLASMPRRFKGRFLNNLVLRKAAATFALVLLFVGTVFHFFGNDVPRVEASALTLLEEVSGEVTVIRESQEIKGIANFTLKADDVIRTGKNSRASIRFMDESVSRLAPNTEVKISTLFVNPLNKSETTVEVVLNYGRLWSRVINLIDGFSSFQVKTKNTVAVAKKKAAFDVSVSPKGKAKVVAVQNRVDLMVAVDKKVVETTLMKGFSAEVKTTVSQAPAIRPASEDSQKDEWVSENLEQDKVYIEAVKQEAGKTLSQTEASTPFTVGLSLDEKDRQMQLLEASRAKIAEAQKALTQGDAVRARALLAEFQSQVSGVASWVKTFAATNPAEAAPLRGRIDALLGEYEKQLALILPTDQLYLMKDAVAQTKVLIAENPLEKTEKQLSAATDKLLEAHDLVEQGETEAAQQNLEEYRKTTSGILEDMKELSADDKEKAVTILLENQVEDLKSLRAITAPLAPLPAESSSALFPPPPVAEGPQTIPEETEKTLEGSPPVLSSVSSEELEQSLEDVKKETLQTMGQTVLEAQQETPSVGLLKTLEEVTNVDVNGKQLINVTLTRYQVFVRSDGTIVSVVPVPVTVPTGSSSTTLPTTSSETREAPPPQP